MIRTILYSLMLSITIHSCANQQKAQTGTAELLVAIERTPCYGSCPIDKFEFYGNNSLIYIGEKFTDSIGRFEVNISNTEAEKIKNLLGKVPVKDLPKVLPENQPIPSDLPAVLYTFPKEDKRLKDYESAPESAHVALFNYIVQLSKSKPLKRLSE